MSKMPRSGFVSINLFHEDCVTKLMKRSAEPQSGFDRLKKMKTQNSTTQISPQEFLRLNQSDYALAAEIPLTPNPESQVSLTLPSPDLSPHLASSKKSFLDLLNSFETFPQNTKSEIIFDLISKCPFSLVRQISCTILPMLKIDFLASLPLELSFHILKHLDLRSLSRCLAVSNTWNKVINSESIQHSIWKLRLILEGWYSEESVQSQLIPFNPKLQHDEHFKLNIPQNFFKDIYKSHFITRRNWLNGKYKNLSFPSHGFNVVTCLQCDDEKIVSGSDDQTIQVFDINTGQLLHRLVGHDGGVWALQYVGNTLVSGSTDRTVRVWDLQSGQCTHILAGHSSTVRCLLIIIPKLNPDTNKYEPELPILATGSRDATVRIWDLPEINKPFENVDTTSELLKYVLTKHSGSVRALAGAHYTLISGSYDMNVCIWDLKTGVCKHVLRGHREKVYSVAYCHKIKRAASGSMDSTVKVWDTVNGSLLFNLDSHSSLVGLLDISEKYIVSAAADGALKIWNPMTGKCYSTLFGHSAPITCFDFNSKLNRFVSGSDGGVKLWELNSFGYGNIEPYLMESPAYGQDSEGMVPIYGRMILDLVGGVAGVWRVSMDERRLVCAVQKQNATTWFEVFDFGSFDEIGLRVVGEGDSCLDNSLELNEEIETSSTHSQDSIDDDSIDEDEEPDERESHHPPPAPLIRTLTLPTFPPTTSYDMIRTSSINILTHDTHFPPPPSMHRPGLNRVSSVGSPQRRHLPFDVIAETTILPISSTHPSQNLFHQFAEQRRSHLTSTNASHSTNIIDLANILLEKDS